MKWSGAELAASGRLRGTSATPARLTKLAYAERLVAAIALLFIRQRDAVGLIRFDDEVRTAIPPRARGAQWRRLIAALDDAGAGRASRAPDALARAASLVRRRGMVVLVSDLLMDVAEVEQAVRALRAAGHTVVVLHVMDPAERDLPATGDAVFVDPESGLEVPASVAEVRAAYRATVEEAIAEWRSTLARAGAAYEVVLTDAPFGVPLRRAFAAREELL
jgi:uncharacterized protein (DUF58 family)